MKPCNQNSSERLSFYVRHIKPQIGSLMATLIIVSLVFMLMFASSTHEMAMQNVLTKHLAKGYVILLSMTLYLAIIVGINVWLSCQQNFLGSILARIILTVCTFIYPLQYINYFSLLSAMIMMLWTIIDFELWSRQGWRAAFLSLPWGRKKSSCKQGEGL